MNNTVVLTQSGPHGIRYDFTDGCRVFVPEGGNWRIRLRDVDTDTVVFDHRFNGGIVQSAKHYYVRYEIIVWKDDVVVFSHECDLKGRDVHIQMDLGGVGDHLAWMGHVVEFTRRHGCRLTCLVRPDVISLLKEAYPKIRFLVPGEEDVVAYYAAYKVLIFFDDVRFDYQPNDYRQVGLCKSGAYILGLPPEERRPTVTVAPGGRPMKERYVCIATQASSLNKYWNNPRGWHDLVAFLNAQGYRVVCIDLQRVNGQETVWRHIPYGVQDETGNRPLTERARWLKHADFFVGLSSGLSWLAWAVETPVVMISGFTEPYNEFTTPYRVINRHVCNSCSNDVTQRLDRNDFFFCPRHKGTERVFECTRQISVQQVTSVIATIPGFGVTNNGGE